MTGISITTIALSISLLLFFQRDLSSLELTISFFYFTLFSSFLSPYSLIEPGAPNQQTHTINYFAHTTIPNNHLFAFYSIHF